MLLQSTLIEPPFFIIWSKAEKLTQSGFVGFGVGVRALVLMFRSIQKASRELLAGKAEEEDEAAEDDGQHTLEVIVSQE